MGIERDRRFELGEARVEWLLVFVKMLGSSPAVLWLSMLRNWAFWTFLALGGETESLSSKGSTLIFLRLKSWPKPWVVWLRVSTALGIVLAFESFLEAAFLVVVVFMVLDDARFWLLSGLDEFALFKIGLYIRGVFLWLPGTTSAKTREIDYTFSVGCVYVGPGISGLAS